MFYYSDVPPYSENFNPQLEDATTLFARLGVTYVDDVVPPAGWEDCTSHELFSYSEYKNLMQSYGMEPTIAGFNLMNEQYKNYQTSSPFVKSNKLALCFINDKVGHGVFAMQDIPDRTIIDIYAGELQSLEKLRSIPTENATYNLSTGDSEWIINARKQGNITRFMQQLPDDNTLAECELGSFPGIARQNVEPYFDERTYRVNGREITLHIPRLVSCRPIKQYEQIGYQYATSNSLCPLGLLQGSDSLHMQNIFNNEYVFFGSRGRVLGTLEELREIQLRDSIRIRDKFVNNYGLDKNIITPFFTRLRTMETSPDDKS